jgi:hypothetical protein
MAVGAAGALTEGENKLPPVGLIDFSVGAGAGADVVALVVVVVGVVVSGAFSPSPQAVKAPIPTMAPMAAVAARRRAVRPDIMAVSYLCRELNYIVQKSR